MLAPGRRRTVLVAGIISLFAVFLFIASYFINLAFRAPQPGLDQIGPASVPSSSDSSNVNPLQHYNDGGLESLAKGPLIYRLREAARLYSEWKYFRHSLAIAIFVLLTITLVVTLLLLSGGQRNEIVDVTQPEHKPPTPEEDLPETISFGQSVGKWIGENPRPSVFIILAIIVIISLCIAGFTRNCRNRQPPIDPKNQTIVDTLIECIKQVREPDFTLPAIEIDKLEVSNTLRISRRPLAFRIDAPKLVDGEPIDNIVALNLLLFKGLPENDYNIVFAQRHIIMGDKKEYKFVQPLESLKSSEFFFVDLRENLFDISEDEWKQLEKLSAFLEDLIWKLRLDPGMKFWYGSERTI